MYIKLLLYMRLVKTLVYPRPPPLILKMIETVTDNKRRRIVMIDR